MTISPGRHAAPVDGAVTVNGHHLELFPLSGPVSGWPQRPVPDGRGQDGTAADKPARTRRGRYPWPLMLIAASAAVAVWSGWVGLGGMCGFGPVRLLPGIADGFTVNAAITLPVGVEAYGAYALYVWLAGKGSAKTCRFARRSAFAAFGLGCFGQVAFHLCLHAGWTVAPWPVVVGVSCLPVLTLSFAAALVHMTLADARGDTADDAQPEDEPQADQPDSSPDNQVDKKVDRRVDKPRTAMDKAAAAIRRHPDLVDKKAWTALAKAAGVSPKTIKRYMDKTGSPA